jgi:hypothetical protein
MTSACFLHILLCNHKRPEFGISDVNLGSVCALVGYQWCGGLYFTGAAISKVEKVRYFCVFVAT